MINQSAITSIKDIENYVYEKRIPYLVNIELLTGCNLNCVHCYIPKHDEQHLSYEDIDNIFRQLKKLGTFMVVLTGGEIFVRKDIFDIIERARFYGFRTILFTNTTLLNLEKIERLKELYVYEVSTSIYSMDSRIHDLITTVEGSLDMTLKNIRLIKNIGINVEVKTPFMVYNKDCFDDIANYCDENGYAFNSSTTIFRTTDGSRTNEEIRVDGNDLEILTEKIDDYRRNSNSNESKRDFDKEDFVCNELRTTLGIGSNGDVYPCSSFPLKLGNIREKTLAEMWNSVEEKKIQFLKKKDLKKCVSCQNANFCDICPGLSYMETTDYLGCSEAAKRVAILRYNCASERKKHYGEFKRKRKNE